MKKFKFLPKLKNFQRFYFSFKDDKFWEDYSKRKTDRGKLPALESQDIIINKVVHSWKFSSNHSLTNEELFEALKSLEPKENSPFTLIDVREDSELELFKLPKRTKNQSEIPIIYRNMDDINHGNWEGIPLNKYLVLIDSIGLRARRASQILANEGYLTLYVEGGYDLFIPLLKEKGL